MPKTDFEALDDAEDNETDAVGTPEGDNEFAPDQPLKPVPPGAEQMPRGGAPDPYKGE